MTDRELMQQALYYMDDGCGKYSDDYRNLIEALRARLAEPESYAAQAAMVAGQTQGRMYVDPVTGDVGIGNPNQVTLDTSGATGFSLTPIHWDASAPLVTTQHPAFKKPWVGLTDEEIDEKTDFRATVRYFEAKLKEKNT